MTAALNVLMHVLTHVHVLVIDIKRHC